MTKSDVSILPLELHGVCYDAGGRRLIHDVSFALEPGPRTIILGPNGAGKSLILRLCHGLLRPTAGTVAWRGTMGRDPRRHQAMVFQRPVMLRRSARANVDYALALRGLKRRDRRLAVDDVLARTGLASLHDRPARVMSAGEQQRLALARAWALKPQVLFLDEPTANLDPSATRAVEETVTAIHETGTRIVMTTHDLGQAHRMADEVIFVHRGRILEKTPAAIFFESPETEPARAFLEGELLW